MNNNTYYSPYATDYVVPQNKPDKQRSRLAVSPDPTILYQHPFHSEADQYGKPEVVNVIAV
jgi:hypothetical protein